MDSLGSLEMMEFKKYSPEFGIKNMNWRKKSRHREKRK